jgi:diguanylate cyclase (GGDEF)-like protein
VSSRGSTTAEDGISPPLLNAQRDALVLAVLIAAVGLLIWNGSTLFHQMALPERQLAGDVQILTTALTLNLALILYGWRRYVDLQHEAELRSDGERRAAMLAATDSHSGLLNRKGFAERAQQMCVDASELAIISVQLHRLKAMTDRHGYEVGDALIRGLAAAINDALPSTAAVARLGTDEFAVAIALGTDGCEDVERMAAKVLRAVTRPFPIGERVLQVGAFAGIAASAAANLRVPDLLRRADIAMDHAKNGRVARPVWFDAGMERALLAHGEVEQGLRQALEHDQIVPFFEPQIDLQTGEIVGFEVLARWIHPLSGTIGADRFIPIAEEIGLIGPLSEKVIEAALREAVNWDPAISISVNVSPSQLADSWLAQRIVRLLTRTNFPAERLVVEITESSLFADIDLARSIVTSLKNQGIRIALDDFGTGYSSLSHLRTLPFDLIKIDRSFVANVQSDKESLAIIRAVATLANALSMPVCVEGIEDGAAHAAVAGLGCEIGQGWYFGKPMCADDAAEMLRQRTSLPSDHTQSSAA